MRPTVKVLTSKPSSASSTWIFSLPQVFCSRLTSDTALVNSGLRFDFRNVCGRVDLTEGSFCQRWGFPAVHLPCRQRPYPSYPPLPVVSSISRPSQSVPAPSPFPALFLPRLTSPALQRKLEKSAVSCILVAWDRSPSVSG